MTLRQLPGATVLGLVAALVSHAVLFGDGHVWAGTYHGAFLQCTLAGIAGLLAAAGALLWSGAACAADGTVLAARLRALLPGWAAIAASGIAWYVLGEALEPAHADVSVLAAGLTLATVAWLVARTATAALRALAEIVFAVATGVRATEPPFDTRITRGLEPHHARRDTTWRARLLRAPPVTANA